VPDAGTLAIMQYWYVYIVRCVDGSFYTGITTDLQRREREHNEGGRSGARYTRARRPVQMVWAEAHSDRSAALKREYAIKQLTRMAKRKLVEEGGQTTPSKPVLTACALAIGADENLSGR